jgi:hypothetical protein
MSKILFKKKHPTTTIFATLSFACHLATQALTLTLNPNSAHSEWGRKEGQVRSTMKAKAKKRGGGSGGGQTKTRPRRNKGEGKDKGIKKDED